MTAHPADAGSRRRPARSSRPAAIRIRPAVRDQRSETPLQRLDRNWADLLQELRVLQTGVQLLTGFLLTIPFQPVFAQLPHFSRMVYLGTLSASVIATGFLIAPVSLHRWLFRRHERRVTVDTAHRLAQIGLLFLAVAVVGMVQLIFDVVVDRTVGLLAALAVSVLLLTLWLALPLAVRSRADRRSRPVQRNRRAGYPVPAGWPAGPPCSMATPGSRCPASGCVDRPRCLPFATPGAGYLFQCPGSRVQRGDNR